MDQDHPASERRQYVRMKKNYFIRFSEKTNPTLKIQVSQIENISRGGVCFSSSIAFQPGTDVAIEMRTPYLAEAVYFEGHILESKEKIKGLIYANRLKFYDLSPQAIDILDKIEKYTTHQS